MSKRRPNRSEAGVTLIELLAVVGIIGLLTLIGVPAFLTYYQAAKVSSSTRQFTTDLRSARQRAVTRARPTMVSFQTGGTVRNYQIFDGTAASPITWTALGSERQLNDTVYLHSTTFTNVDTSADGSKDIVFLPSGEIRPIPTISEGGKDVSLVVLRTDQKVPYNEFKLYLTRSGQMIARRSSF